MRALIKYRFEIGVLICMFATQFARILIELFRLTLDLSTILMIIGLMLTLDWNNIANLKFPRFTKNMAMLALYQIIVIFYALMSDS